MAPIATVSALTPCRLVSPSPFPFLQPPQVGADLANIVNEAAMTAARQGRALITARDIYSGVDRFTQVGGGGGGAAGAPKQAG
jgi:hypothetical protein